MYRALYEAGDEQGMEEMRELLVGSGLGYRSNSFGSWVKAEKT